MIMVMIAHTMMIIRSIVVILIGMTIVLLETQELNVVAVEVAQGESNFSGIQLALVFSEALLDAD